MNRIVLSRNKDYTFSDNLITLLCLLYFGIDLLITFQSIGREVATYLCLGVAFIAVIVALVRRDQVGLLKSELLFYGAIVFLHTLSIFYNHNFSYSSILLVMRHFFIAMAIARTKLNMKYITIVFWLLILYFTYLLATGYYTGGIDRSVSQNVISVYLILFLAMFFFANKNTLDLNSWMMAGASLIIIIWTGSRGGIISVVTLLVGMFIHGRKEIKYKHMRIKFLIGILVAIAITMIGIWYIDKKVGIEYYLLLLTRSRESLGDNVRFRIISEYIDATNTSFGSLLFGVRLGSTNLIGILDGNPHNSYIYAHANFGILYLIIILFLLIRAERKYYLKKEFLFYVLLSVALRSFSDITAFPGIYDALFYYLIFERLLTVFDTHGDQLYEKDCKMGI